MKTLVEPDVYDISLEEPEVKIWTLDEVTIWTLDEPEIWMMLLNLQVIWIPHSWYRDLLYTENAVPPENIRKMR